MKRRIDNYLVKAGTHGMEKDTVGSVWLKRVRLLRTKGALEGQVEGNLNFGFVLEAHLTVVMRLSGTEAVEFVVPESMMIQHSPSVDTPYGGTTHNAEQMEITNPEILNFFSHEELEKLKERCLWKSREPRFISLDDMMLVEDDFWEALPPTHRSRAPREKSEMELSAQEASEVLRATQEELATWKRGWEIAETSRKMGL